MHSRPNAQYQNLHKRIQKSICDVFQRRGIDNSQFTILLSIGGMQADSTHIEGLQ